MSSNFQPPALIPAAGRGTRLRPITSYLSKPMLPLGDQPAVKFVIEEAFRAGCRPVVVIVNSDDSNLKTYLEKDCPRTVVIVQQPRPRGLAEALLRGYGHLDYEGPVAMLLADNIVLNSRGLEFIIKNKLNDWLTFGTVKVTGSEAKFYGNSGGYEGKPIDNTGGKLEKIFSLQSKGKGDFSRAKESWPARRTVGRALLPPDFFAEARQLQPDPESGELDDVPIYRRLLDKKPATGVLLPEKVYDMGQPERYLRLCSDRFEAEIESSGRIQP
ncbi:MAG: sugar phosphate nucleotidyltransferase [bacterium]